jgi:hypothetical protein
MEIPSENVKKKKTLIGVVGLYIDNCRYEIQEQKGVPVWYIGIPVRGIC